MSLRIAFHELAEAELNEAALYYENEGAGLGRAFLSEVEHSIEQIRENPESCPIILKVVRRKLLRRFPYSILFSIVKDNIYILAIANQKRRPFYWRNRR
jgi:toxin ParE1/3/4